jgi:hypothetical protein
MGSTALHADTTTRIATLKTRRDLIETQIMRVITGGQSFGVSGSMQVSQVPLAELRKELERVKREILLLTAGEQGNIVLPDFSHEDGGQSDPDVT